MTNPKTRPIIFSGPMVRAILDGRKTQTRRIMKPQPKYIRGNIAPQQKRGEPQKHPAPYFDAYNHGPFWCWWDEYDRQGNDWIKCPYGAPGDRLWVRETFFIETNFNLGDYPPPFDDGRPVIRHLDSEFGDWWEQPHYRATDAAPDLHYEDCDEPACRWTPSIFMPRWASRIEHEITDVRVERVQDISEEDAFAEGYPSGIFGPPSPRDWYKALFISINGKRSWDANPYVLALTFKVVS